jgi:hypothetical protein
MTMHIQSPTDFELQTNKAILQIRQQLQFWRLAEQVGLDKEICQREATSCEMALLDVIDGIDA